MKDLFDLLKEQIAVVPIGKDRYFYNADNNQLYGRHYTKFKPLNGVSSTNAIVFITENNSTVKISKLRIICFIQNGLSEGMSSLLDKTWTVHEDSPGKYKWITLSEKKLQFNKDRLKKVFEDHPDLYIKHGFFDEGPIPYKPREGFYIVPLTNGTFAINPVTQEAVYTYSNELLKPQFHERGDRKFTLNERLSGGKTTIISSRAIVYVTKPIPDKYKTIADNIPDIVNELDIDHIDSDPSNNDISNLQYLTRQENLTKKLNQEMDPRVFPTTWLSPDGNIVRFRSIRDVSIKLNCNLAAVTKICRGWRNEDTLLGWKLIEGKKEHPLESIYLELERRGYQRGILTKFNNKIMVYDVVNKQFGEYNSLKELCEYKEVKKSGLETHIHMKGPLVPYRDLIVFPEKVLGALIEMKYFEIFLK